MTDDELKSLFQAMRQEMTAMRQENADAHAETRRQFGATQEHMESRFELLAETVQLLDANQRATARTLDDKIERLVGETQGLIRFTFEGLNRRVLVLEGNAGTKK